MLNCTHLNKKIITWKWTYDAKWKFNGKFATTTTTNIHIKFQQTIQTSTHTQKKTIFIGAMA